MPRQTFLPTETMRTLKQASFESRTERDLWAQAFRLNSEASINGLSSLVEPEPAPSSPTAPDTMNLEPAPLPVVVSPRPGEEQQQRSSTAGVLGPEFATWRRDGQGAAIIQEEGSQVEDGGVSSENASGLPGGPSASPVAPAEVPPRRQAGARGFYRGPEDPGRDDPGFYRGDADESIDPGFYRPGYAPSSGRGAEGVERWSDLVAEAARAYNLPEATIKGLMEIESGGNPEAVSAAGAQGLMQVMPFHFQAGENPRDPRTNIMRGAKVYADALARWGDPDKAAAAYFGAIDGNGNITGATDATGTDGHHYVRLWRNAAAKYGGLPNAGAGAPQPAPAVPSSIPTTGGAASPTAPAGGSGGADTVTIQHIDNGRTLTVPRANLPGYLQSPAPNVPPMWQVVSGSDGQDMQRVALSEPQPMPEDATLEHQLLWQTAVPNEKKPPPLRNTIEYHDTTSLLEGDMPKAPLLPTDPEATTGEAYDPRLYDEGAREWTPPPSDALTSAPLTPSASTETVPLSSSSPYDDPDSGPREALPGSVGAQQLPVWNAQGQVIGYRQEEPPAAPSGRITWPNERQLAPAYGRDTGEVYGPAPVPEPPARFSPEVQAQLAPTAENPDIAPQPSAPLPGTPSLPGVAGRTLTEAVNQAGASQTQQINPLAIYQAISEVPFDVYARARSELISDAEQGRLTGTDPLAPFRAMGVQFPDWLSPEAINPEGRPAGDIVPALVMSGVLPDPADPLVQQGFRLAGRGIGAVGRRVGQEAASLPILAERGAQAAGRAGRGLAEEGARQLMDLTPTPRMVQEGDGTVAPRRMYHGTNAAFERYEPGDTGVLGSGVYLSEDPARAGIYASREGGNIRPVDVPSDLRMFDPSDARQQRAVIDEMMDIADVDTGANLWEARDRGFASPVDFLEQTAGRHRGLFQRALDNLRFDGVEIRPGTVPADEATFHPQVLIRPSGLERIQPQQRPGLLGRARVALAQNAENVARADARITAQGSTTAPGTLGVAMGTDAQGAARRRVVPPEVADQLDFPLRIPDDPAFARAVEAAGGRVDPERGTDLNLIRYQGPEAAGRTATRGGTFYTTGRPGEVSPYAAGEGAQVGGSERIDAPSRFRSPLVLDDAPGSRRGFNDAVALLASQDQARGNAAAVEAAERKLQEAQAALRAYRDTLGDDRYGPKGLRNKYVTAVNRASAELNALRDQASSPLMTRDGQIVTSSMIDAEIADARYAGPEGSPERAQALKDLVSRYGGDPNLIDDLLAIRGADASESAWAIKENILSHNARRAGYDGVLTVQQQMGADYQKALEAAVQAHPDYKAQQAVIEQIQQELDRLEAQRAAIPSQGGDLNRAYASVDNAIEDAMERATRAEIKLERIHDRLIDEVDVPVPSKITELMDVREGANPTPGAEHPIVAEIQGLYDDALAAEAQAQRNARYQQSNLSGFPDDHPFRNEVQAQYEQARAALVAATQQRLKLQRALDTLKTQPDLTPSPPGYTLRSDIRRRGGETDAGASLGASPVSVTGLGTRLAADVGSSLGSGTMGAAVGAGLPAETDEERRRNALTGAAVGMVGGPLASRAMRGTRGALATPGVSPGRPDPNRRLRLRGQQAITMTPDQEVSRLRLDKFPEEVRADIEAGAREQDWARTQRRGVLPDAVVQQMAQDDIVSVDRLIKGGRAGKAYNAEETLAVRNAVASQARVVRELSEEIAQARAGGVSPELLVARRAAEATKLNGLIQIAEGARAEAGRTLRAYRQQANLIEMNPTEAVERIYRKLGGRDNAQAAVDEYTRMVQDGADPIQLAKFWAKVEAGKITGSDLFALYRRFNMLSGPRTFEVNALSGAVNLGYEVVGSGLGRVARGRLGEAATEIAAPLKASGRAFRNLAETLRHGVSMEQAARGDIPRSLSNRTDNPVARGALTVLETPDRVNAAVDQFFRTMTEEWAATRLAHQQAREANLTPRSADWAETVAKNLEAIRDDPSKFPEIKAMADRVTFSEEPGSIGKGLEAFRQKSPLVANLLFPFIRTPYNIASRAVDLSPLGIVRTGAEAATGIGRGRENLSPRVRDAMIGTAATIWAYDQAQRGNITGAGPDDPEKLAQLRATGWQPYSVKMGDQYWSYANFAPFSLALSAGAAASEAQKYKKPGKDDTLSLLSDGAARTAKVVTDMTVLAGLGAVVKSIEDPDRYGGRWLSQFLQTLIPAGSALNTVGQATDPNMRRAERDTFGNQVWGDMLARIPPNPFTPDRMDVPAAQDPLGRAVPNEQTGFGALNPFRPTTERPDPVIQQFIDAKVDIGKPRQDISISIYGGDGRVAQSIPMPLTPAEQRRWNELRGTALQDILRGIELDPQWAAAPAADKQRYLQSQLTVAGDYATRTIRETLSDDEITRRIAPLRRAS